MVHEAMQGVATHSRVIPGLVPGIQLSPSSVACSGARRFHLSTVGFTDRWIPATSVGMTDWRALRWAALVNRGPQQ